MSSIQSRDIIMVIGDGDYGPMFNEHATVQVYKLTSREAPVSIVFSQSIYTELSSLLGAERVTGLRCDTKQEAIVSM